MFEKWSPEEQEIIIEENIFAPRIFDENYNITDVGEMCEFILDKLGEM